LELHKKQENKATTVAALQGSHEVYFAWTVITKQGIWQWCVRLWTWNTGNVREIYSCELWQFRKSDYNE